MTKQTTIVVTGALRVKVFEYLREIHIPLDKRGSGNIFLIVHENILWVLIRSALA